MQTLTKVPTLPSDEALARCEQIIQHHSQTFYLATSLLPAETRRAVRALYAFCRTTDDLVDDGPATPADLARWQAEVAKPACHQDDPVLRSWALTRERFGINPRYERELIEGVAMDLQPVRFASWPELERYCYLVASTVGLLSMPIIGLARGVTFAEAAPLAIKLGIALQLTNILRDVGEDARRGRVYLPASDLARFGLSADDILDGLHDERFVSLMRFEIARARRFFDEALPGIALLSPSARPAVGAAAIFYRAILDAIEAIDYRVHTHRAITSRAKKLRMLPGILWTVLRLRRAPQGLRSGADWHHANSESDFPAASNLTP